MNRTHIIEDGWDHATTYCGREGWAPKIATDEYEDVMGNRFAAVGEAKAAKADCRRCQKLHAKEVQSRIVLANQRAREASP